jgi:hypothetical protein
MLVVRGQAARYSALTIPRLRVQLVAQSGAVTSGGSNLAKMYSNIAGHFVLAVMLDQIHSQGDGGWALAHGTQTFPDGHVVKTHAVFIYGRENGDLKFRVLSFGTNVPFASAK